MKFSFNKKNKEGGAGPKPVPRSNLMHEIHSDPFLDWALILALTFVTAGALVAVGISMYLETGSRLGKPLKSSPKASRTAFDTALLAETLSAYDERAAERKTIEKGYAAPRDPSLP